MYEDLVGLIPAAGKGVRLGLPYPKELYPIIRNNRYKPVAQFVVDNMTGAGLQHVVFVINETKHQLIGYFGSGQRFGCDISYVVQEQTNGEYRSTSPGLAHALDAAYHVTKGKTVFFGMADTIMQPTDVFKRAYESMPSDAEVVLILFTTQRPEKFGMVRLGDNRRVIEIVDKPRTTDLTEMWGCIIWRPRFTDFLHQCVHQDHIADFALIMNRAIAAGMVFYGAHMAGGSYSDLGTYEEVSAIDHRFREE